MVKYGTPFNSRLMVPNTSCNEVKQIQTVSFGGKKKKKKKKKKKQNETRRLG